MGSPIYSTPELRFRCEDWLTSRDETTIRHQLSISSKFAEAFATTLADRTWITTHRALSFKAVKVLPKDTPNRARLLTAMTNAGLFQALSKEAIDLLRSACEDNDSMLVDALFQAIDPAARDAAGNTALHHICRYGSEDVIRSILRKIQESNTWGSKAMQFLGLAANPLSFSNARGRYPLQMGHQNGKVADFQNLLVEAGILDSTDIALDTQEDTLLTLAAWHGNTDHVKSLILRGANIDAKSGPAGRTALMVVCAAGNTAMAKLLLNAGASIDEQSNRDENVLRIAIEENRRDIVRLLIRHGADVNAKSRDGKTPLESACLKDNMEIARLLINAGANVDLSGEYSDPPLMTACYHGRTEMARLLINAGAQIDVQNSNGDTALTKACQTDESAIVELLLKAGASINMQNNYGETALSKACHHGNPKIVELLLDANADINICGIYGQTPLRYALGAPKLANTVALARLRLGDDGTTRQIFLNKELAHRFGLRGQLLIRNKEVQLTGWQPEDAKKTLELSVEKFYNDLSNTMTLSAAHQTQTARIWTNIEANISERTLKKIRDLGEEKIKEILAGTLEAIRTSLSDAETAQRRLDAGQPVGLIMSMFLPKNTSHCVAMAMLRMEDGKYRIARCNKGGECGLFPGILIDTAENVDISMVYPTVTRSYFNDTVKDNFRFSPEIPQRYVKQKRQKVGNCTVANTNGMELALLILQLEPLLGYNEAVEFAQAIKKFRCEDSRVGTLKAYLQFHEENPQFMVNLPLLEAIRAKKYRGTDEDRECKRVIEEWITTHIGTS